MKRETYRNIILASLLLLGGCKSLDCGCPMSTNIDNRQAQDIEEKVQIQVSNSSSNSYKTLTQFEESPLEISSQGVNE